MLGINISVVVEKNEANMGRAMIMNIVYINGKRRRGPQEYMEVQC